MTSDEIFDAIEQIAATSSKTGKQALIEKHKDDERFVEVLVAALDPFVTYGLAKRPDVISAGAGQFDEDVWDVLEALSTRKLTGNAAKLCVGELLAQMSPKSGELLWRIISKDLRAGFSESTVNKVIPGTIPTFDCMLAHPFEVSRINKWPVVAEPKLDGVRVLAFVDLTEGPSVRFFSRSGKEFTTFDHLKPALIELIDAFRADLRENGDDYDAEYFKYFIERLDCEEFAVVFDGEIVSGSFNKTVSEVRRKDLQATDAIFNVFDILPMSLFSKDDKVPSKHTYVERRKVLEELLPKGKSGPVHLLPRYLVSSEAEIHALYEAVRARGLEGLIIKTDSPYYRRRNHAWMKIKAEETLDLLVTGWEPGTGKYVGMIGALIVDHKGVPVNVGSGLSDDLRQENPDEIVGRLIEVEYHEITPDGSLRHPRFKRFRDDKS